MKFSYSFQYSSDVIKQSLSQCCREQVRLLLRSSTKAIITDINQDLSWNHLWVLKKSTLLVNPAAINLLLTLTTGQCVVCCYIPVGAAVPVSNCLKLGLLI
jgi:hypothetical protein